MTAGFIQINNYCLIDWKDLGYTVVANSLERFHLTQGVRVRAFSLEMGLLCRDLEQVLHSQMLNAID